jgi:hypothetical protein
VIEIRTILCVQRFILKVCLWSLILCVTKCTYLQLHEFKFKAKHESQQSSSLIRPSVTHVCFETSLCVHVFMCVTLLVVIMLGANLIAFNKVVS